MHVTRAQTVAVGDLIYIIGGLDDTDNVTDDVLVYDTVLDVFTAGPKLPSPLYRFGVAYLPATSAAPDGVIYVIGGLESLDPDAAPTGSVHVLNLTSMEWSGGPQLGTRRSDLCAHGVNGRVYVAGGWTAGFASTLGLVQVLDPENGSWVEVEEMPTPRGDCKCGALGDKFVVVGGFFDPLNLFRESLFRAEVEAYDTVGKRIRLPNTVS